MENRRLGTIVWIADGRGVGHREADRRSRRTDDIEERDSPTDDLKAVYHLAGHDYTKKRDRLNAVVSKLDFKYFTNGLCERMPSLDKFVLDLEYFFKEDF